MREKINVFIPSAGFGTRLKPITNSRPKPLLPVLGSALIDNVVNNFSGLEIDRVIINTHFLPERMNEWVDNSQLDIVALNEQELQGTGGALKNASDILRTSPFLVHNSDVLSDINLLELLEYHKQKGSIATLAVIDNLDVNSVGINSNGQVLSVGDNGDSNLVKNKVTFSGIAIYQPEFLDFLPIGKSDLTDAWFKAIAAGEKIETCMFENLFWNDLGTPERYVACLVTMLSAKGQTISINNVECVPSSAELKQFVVVEDNVLLGENIKLNNVVVLPGALIADGEELSCCIRGRDFSIEIAKEYFEPPSNLPGTIIKTGSTFFNSVFGDIISPLFLPLIGKGGSDRAFFAIDYNNTKAVLMQFPENDAYIKQQLEFSRFFLFSGVKVPKLLAVEEEKGMMLFEDLGRYALREWCMGKSLKQIEEIYRKIIDQLVLLHSLDSIQCPLVEESQFDYKAIRWESDYFLQRFVKGYNMFEWEDYVDPVALEIDLDKLAKVIDCLPKGIMHRDFQSTNVMIKENNPYIIDFQGAKMGPGAYDLMSLLKDPYRFLDVDLRKRLIVYYIKSKRKIDPDFDPNLFRDSLTVCAVSRHMQALGAYGFLVKVKGKKYFEKFVRPAMDMLKEEAERLDEHYPNLAKLIRNIRI